MLCARRKRAVNTLQQIKYLRAVEVLERCEHTITGKFDILRHISAATTHCADSFTERCTNAVASPFGVTGV